MTEIHFDEYDYDETQEEPKKRALIPEGRYRCIITEEEKGENKAGTGENLKLTIEIVAGEFAGRYVWQNIVWKHNNPEPAHIGRKEFADLRKALGIIRPTDTVQLLNVPFDAVIGIAKGKNGFADKNKIKQYIPQSGFAAQKPAPKQEKIEKKDEDDNVPW